MSIRFSSRLVIVLGLLFQSHSIGAASQQDGAGSQAAHTFDSTNSLLEAEISSPAFSDDSSLPAVAVTTSQPNVSTRAAKARANVYYAQGNSDRGETAKRSTNAKLWNPTSDMSADSPSVNLAEYQVDRIYNIYLADDNSWTPAKPMSLTEPIATLSNGDLANATLETNSGGKSEQTNWSIGGIAIDMQVVPLTGAAWLFGSAMLGLFGVARRKTA